MHVVDALLVADEVVLLLFGEVLLDVQREAFHVFIEFFIFLLQKDPVAVLPPGLLAGHQVLHLVDDVADNRYIVSEVLLEALWGHTRGLDEPDAQNIQLSISCLKDVYDCPLGLSGANLRIHVT